MSCCTGAFALHRHHADITVRVWHDRYVRMVGIAFAASMLVACVRSGATTCTDGTICRDGTVCAPAGDRTLCVTPEQVRACDGLVEAASCGSDRCYAVDDGLVCLPIGCGNTFVDREEREQCDDGNNTSEDGCSADCLSDETCGNGVIDPLFGERCDDGNIVSHDGCSSRCDDEAARWVETFDTYIPGVRSDMGMTYDVRRGRVVIFGGVEPGAGSSSGFPTTTTEWDGAFYEETSTTAPEGRAKPALAYDERRGTTVLFGGVRAGGLSADTWEWTGTDWRPVDASGPSARVAAALAYDSVGDRVVLFGGRDGKKDVGDSWELKNGLWTQLPDGPPISRRGSMTFDPIAGVTVLVAGREHWELEGTAWTRIGTVPALDTQPMWIVFETSLGKRLLLGEDGNNMLKTWMWSGTAWTELVRSTVLANSVRSVVADRVHGGLIALRVAGWARWSPTGELTTIDNPTFVDARIATGAAAANDLRRRVVVEFGGNRGDRTNPVRTDDMFVFDGRAWKDLAPTTKPSARWNHAMAYDAVHDRIVLFGGDAASGLSRETWLWDGAVWSNASPAMSPTARAGHSMAFDPDSGRVVLFGGADIAGPSNETWEWDGQTWVIRVLTTNMPNARVGTTLAADPIGGGLLLFGGAESPDADIAFDDTWRLTASGWTLLDTVVVPSGRRFATLTAAPARRRLLLTGGERIDTSGIVARPVVLPDAWEWDGARWRSLPSSSHPVTQHVAFASPDGTTVMTMGGIRFANVGAEGVFEHRWSDSGAYETCAGRLDADGDGRAACADPDCWSLCTPLCMPGETSCPTSPTCGDGTCSSLETAWTCPMDCGAAPIACGDLVCDPSETCSSECP